MNSLQKNRRFAYLVIIIGSILVATISIPGLAFLFGVVGSGNSDFTQQITVESNQVDLIIEEPISEDTKIPELGFMVNMNNVRSEIQIIPTNEIDGNLHEQPDINLESLEMQIYDISNQNRNNFGLAELNWDDSLGVIARNHSKDMAENDYFSHVDLDGRTASDRAEFHGYSCEKEMNGFVYSGIGENVFRNNLYSVVYTYDDIPVRYEWNTTNDIVKTTIDGWMASPAYQGNMLSENYESMGVGVVISNERVYITQNFC